MKWGKGSPSAEILGGGRTADMVELLGYTSISSSTNKQ